MNQFHHYKSNNNEAIIPETDVNSKETYRNICKVISAFKGKLLPNNGDCSYLSECTVFRLLSERAGGWCFECPDEIDNDLQEQVNNAIEIANLKLRFKMDKKKKKIMTIDNNTETNKTTTTSDLPGLAHMPPESAAEETDDDDTDDKADDDDQSASDNEYKSTREAGNNDTVDEANDGDSPCDNAYYKSAKEADGDNAADEAKDDGEIPGDNADKSAKDADGNNVDGESRSDDVLYICNKRYSCCVCRTTSTKDKTVTFTKIPTDMTSQIEKHSSDTVRKTHYRKLFRRKIFKERLGLKPDDPRKFLTICSKHLLVKENFLIKWIDINDNEREMNHKMIVPIDVRVGNLRTRQQSINCEVVSPRPRRPRKRQKIIQAPKAKEKKNYRRKCHFVGCKTCARKDSDITFHRIPTHELQPSASSSTRNFDRMRYAIRKKFRDICLLRIGYPVTHTAKDLRICNKHKVETIEENVEWYDVKGNEQITKVTMYVPSNDYVQDLNEPDELSSQDKELLNYLIKARKEAEKNPVLKARLLQIGGFSSMEDKQTENNRKKRFDVDYPGKRCKEEDSKVRSGDPTTIQFDKLTDEEVNTRTGFPSKLCLITMIIIVCEGNVDLLIQTTTTLSWLEEWFLYYEMVWRKSTTRWIDAVLRYNKSQRTLRRVFGVKLQLHRIAREKWPQNEEDKKFRKRRLNENGTERVIMWDNRNIIIPMPSSVETQREILTEQDLW